MTVEALAIALARVAPMAALAPIFGAGIAPPLAIAVLAVTVAGYVAVLLPPDAFAAAANPSAAGLAALLAKEAVVGLTLAVIVAVPLWLASAWGRWLGGGVDDDERDVASGPQLFGLLAVAVFFTTDGHLALLRALVASYQQLPLEGPRGSAIAGSIGGLITVGIAAAIPLVLAGAFAAVIAALARRLGGVAAIALPGEAARLAGVTVAVAVGLAAMLVGLADQLGDAYLLLGVTG